MFGVQSVDYVIFELPHRGAVDLELRFMACPTGRRLGFIVRMNGVVHVSSRRLGRFSSRRWILRGLYPIVSRDEVLQAVCR